VQQFFFVTARKKSCAMKNVLTIKTVMSLYQESISLESGNISVIVGEELL